MNITIAKTHVLPVDEAKFSADVRDFIWAYGLRQILNDAGSMGKGPDEKLAMAQKKLDILYSGELRKAREGGAADPLTAEMERLARADVTKALRAKGKSIGKIDKDALSASIAAHLAKNAKHYTALATRNIAERGAVTIDLDDL